MIFHKNAKLVIKFVFNGANNTVITNWKHYRKTKVTKSFVSLKVSGVLFSRLDQFYFGTVASNHSLVSFNLVISVLFINFSAN